jgi:3',5'-cyclic-AMP phosphodiesterase
MPFSFVHISDHHLCESEETLRRGFSPAYAMRSVMQNIYDQVGSQIDFIVSTGDLVEPSTDTAYLSARKLLGAREEPALAPGPIYFTSFGFKNFRMVLLPGNHDDRQPYYSSFFHQRSNNPLVNTSFMHKRVRFVCLDWGALPKGVAYPETLSFLERTLESDIPSVLLMHHHVLPIGSAWLDNFVPDEVDKFWEIIRGKNVLAILSGHVHITYELEKNGVPVMGVRSTAFPFLLSNDPVIALQPPHYRLVTIDGNQLTSKIFEVPL